MGEVKKRKDTPAKKAWDKKNMVFTAFKMFREIEGKPNDQAIIDFLDKQENKSETIKAALREYMERHPNANSKEMSIDGCNSL